MFKVPVGFQRLQGSGNTKLVCDLLEQVQLLTGIHRRELEVLAPYIGAYEVKPGTVIFSEGAKDNFLCFLVEGTADVIKQQTESERRKLATIRAGKTIGEMAFIDKQPHSATVTSPGKSLVLLLTEKDYERLAEENPRLALNLIWRISQLISNRLRQTSGLLVDYL